jgi:hypothetical protein
MNPNIGVIIFTVIEIITMAVWLALVLAGHIVVGTIVLSVGLFLEHVVSVNVGLGKPFFQFPIRRE